MLPNIQKAAKETFFHDSWRFLPLVYIQTELFFGGLPNKSFLYILLFTISLSLLYLFLYNFFWPMKERK